MKDNITECKLTCLFFHFLSLSGNGNRTLLRTAGCGFFIIWPLFPFILLIAKKELVSLEIETLTRIDKKKLKKSTIKFFPFFGQVNFVAQSKRQIGGKTEQAQQVENQRSRQIYHSMSCQHANFLSILVANGISQRLCFLALLRNCFLLGTEQANKGAIGSFCLREIKVLV